MSSTLKQAIQALKARVADAFAAVEAKGGTLPATQDTANLPAAIASIPAGGGGNFSDIGITWVGGETPQATLIQWAADNAIRAQVLTLNDTIGAITTITIPSAFANLVNCNLLILSALVSISGNLVFQNSMIGGKLSLPSLITNTGQTVFNTGAEEIELPAMTSLGGSANIQSCPNLKRIILGININITGSVIFANCPKLIDVVLTNQNGPLRFGSWNPTEGLRTDSSSLVDAGEPFANNLEKFFYCLREHTAAGLNPAGGIITFSAAVKAAILADQPTADAFTNKNWIIA